MPLLLQGENPGQTMNLFTRLFPFFLAWAWALAGCGDDETMRQRPFPLPEFDQPPQLPPQPHRVDAASTNKEIVTSEFIVRTPNTSGVFSDELSVVTLNIPRSGADVYVNLSSVAGATVLANCQFEISAALYAVAGNTRSAVSRGAYRFKNPDVASAPFLRDLYLGAARQGAEKFDVGLRVTGTNVANDANIIGSVTAVGYDEPPGLFVKPYRAYSFAVDSLGFEAVRRPLDLYRIRAMNTSGGVLYLQLFDRNSALAPAALSVPLRSFQVPANNSIEVAWEDAPLRFSEGFQWTSSSTPTVYTAAVGLLANYDYA